MAEAAEKFLLQQMTTAVVAHFQLIFGADNEVAQLQNEVKKMEAALRESGDQFSSRVERQKVYETLVRDALHEAEDILDECFTIAAYDKSRMFKNRFGSPTYGRLANDVKSIRQNTIKPLLPILDSWNNNLSTPQPSPSPPITTDQPNGEITIIDSSEYNGATSQGDASTSQSLVNENLIEYNGATSQGEASTLQSLVSGDLPEQETCMKRGSVVGFEERKNYIITLLTEECTELKVISITGMPGLGKSTLARKVYESISVRAYFPNVIWVDVTQKFDKRKVLLCILKRSAKIDNLPSMSDYELEKAIQLYLADKKFLLIFDDLWNEEDWQAIETALPKANGQGRVLITSRIESVGMKENLSRENYKLRLLDKSKSWDLLQLQVFNKLNTCPKELDDLGKKIAGECGGLPLAIVIIAGVLLKIRSTSTGVNETRIQWRKVSDSVSKYFNENKLMENLIALSYNELPLYLRNCFLYLGVFPEESPIPIRRLIRMWIAEGFISRKANMSLEDVAEENIKELIDRNLVMVDNVKPDGYIKTCRLHSLIREFCKKQASRENHNLFQEMEMSARDGTFYPSITEIQNRRRICIHSHIKDFLEQNPEGRRVHSLLCSAKEAVTSLPEETSPIPLHFNRLRVVDISPIKLTEFPSKLSKLIHLRYIALSADSDVLWNLPKEVSRLWNLQSITIETNSRTFEIKANLWKMMHLRHLKTKAAIILQKKLKGPAGEQLQSVSRLSTQCCTEDVFNKAKNIQNLGICGNLNTILKVSCLRKLVLLQKLKLVHDVYPTEEAYEKPLSRLPNHDFFPQYLRILQLSGTLLTWNQIRMLENLGGLEVLKLKNNAFVGKRWSACEGCFASLEILLIADTDLVVWTAKESYFPELKCLILKNCKQLGGIPLELTANLKILHVENVNKSAVETAEEISCIRSGLKLIITGSGGPASKI